MNHKKQIIFCLLVFLFVAIFTGLIFAHNILMVALILLALLMMLIVLMMLAQEKVLPLSLLWLFVGVMVSSMVAMSSWHTVQLLKGGVIAKKSPIQIKTQVDGKNTLPLFERADVKQVLLLGLLLGLLFLTLCVVVGLLGGTGQKVRWVEPIVATKPPDAIVIELKAEIKKRDTQLKELLNQMKSLQNEHQQLNQQLKDMKDFLYERGFDGNNVCAMLAERFQKVQNDFLLANHETLGESLLAYNRLCMYIALTRKEYPPIFTRVQNMGFDNALGTQLQVNNQAIYKQICWLLFILKYSYNQDAQQLIKQIKQDIEKIDDIDKQKAFWKQLQDQGPRIIIRVKGDIAYVL